MKSHKKSSVTKMVARFDNELKTLLLNDLNNVRGIKNQVMRSAQARLQARISAA
jgi:hypothetical protein